MPQYLPAVIPGQGPVEDAKVRPYPVSGPVPGTGRTGYTPNFTFPEPPQAPPSPGWFKRTASAAGDALRNGASALGDTVAGASAPLRQRFAEGSAYLAGEFKPLGSAPPPADAGLLRRGADKVGAASSKVLRGAAKAAGPAGALVGAAPDALDFAQNYDKRSTEENVVAGAKTVGKAGGGLAGGMLGAQAGATLGLATGPAAPIAAPVLGVVGGVAGSYLGSEGVEKLIDGARGLVKDSPVLGGLRLATGYGLDSKAGAGRGVVNPAVADPRLNSDAGAGRGATADWRANPSRKPPDEIPDLSKDLASVPRDLPANMIDGAIYKTKDANGRTVYSGKNVKFGADIVDGKGRNVGMNRADGRLRGNGVVALDAEGNPTGIPVTPQTVEPGGLGLGGTTTLRGASGAATGLLGAGQGVAMGGALAASQQPMQTEPAGFNTGRNGNALERSPEQQRADAMTQAGSIDPRTRGRGLRTLDSLDKSDAAQLASETAKYGARTAAGASMYGADRGLEGNLAQAQATSLRYGYEQRIKANQMAIQAQAMQMAGGDTRKAAQLILQMGGDPSNLTQAATAFQGLDTKNNEDARGYFRGMATMTDKDNKPYTNEALQNQLYDTAMRMSSGKWAGMSTEERQAMAPEIQAAVQAVGGMNALRNNTLSQMVGWDPAAPEISQLPDLRGATYGRVGKVGGALTPSVSGGDFEIRTAKGDTYYIPADQASERVLRMLENNGATKRKD